MTHPKLAQIFKFLLSSFVFVFLFTACAENKNTELKNALIAYLSEAANKETADRILNIIKAGANPKYDYEGLRPIDVAIEQSHIELARLLIQKGFKPNDPELLSEAVSYVGEDALGISRLLLQAGANPNGRVDYPSPMSRAIEANNLPAIKLLLASGAKLRGNDDEDPFELAARSGHAQVLEYLFTTNTKPSDATELLFAGIASNNPAIVSYLLRDYNSNDRDKELFQLASYGLLDEAPNSFQNAKTIIKLLETKGLSTPADAYDPVVIGSAMLANTDALNYVLAKGGSVNATSEKGKTAIMTIASIDLFEAIAESYREESTADLKTRFSTIEDKHLEIAKLLLQKGADPNYTDEYGRTALMYAAKSLQEPLVDLFLSRKANRHLVDKVGKSAGDYAKQSRPKSPDERDKMANYLASAFGYTPELITELQKRSDSITSKL